MNLLLISACLFGVVSSKIIGLPERGKCRTLGGGQGVCKYIILCKTARNFKNQPGICSFKNQVCCPILVTTKSKPGHKAEKYCAGLNSRNRCTSGLLAYRHKRLTLIRKGELYRRAIIGGEFSMPKTTPFMALIGYGKENQILWGCGGSLITGRYVLSAAHCANPSGSLGIARWARLGDLDISSDKEDAKTITKRIVERITYPEYVDTQSYHDIAIFKLDSDVVFNHWVKPICLQTQMNNNHLATVIGWGRTDFAGATSDHLLEANVNVYNDTECQHLMFSYTNNKTPQGYQRNLMFCAGVPDGTKDACSGDSGGPLVITRPGECFKRQVGITSNGNQCGLENSPGVYTRVSNYVSWIEGIVFGDDIGI